MRVLFCSSWPRDDGLTRATVDPAIATLARLDLVDAVELFAPERPRGAGTIKRFAEVRSDLQTLRSIAQSARPDVIIARGVPAGNIAQRVAKEVGAPLIIESFEPHARYMRDAGEWAWWDPRYLAQVVLERRQRTRAAHLITVAEGYRKELIDSGTTPGDVSVVPCLVDTDRFAFDDVARKEVRSSFGLTDDAVVLVHLGKFGGVYYDNEAFVALATFVDHVGPRAFVIVLTPHDGGSVRARAAAAGVPENQIWVGSVAHDGVPAYLAAADVGLNTWRPIETSYACSPVKNAEYWATGVPVLISVGIGDDSDLVTQQRLGWAGDLADPVALERGIDQALVLTAEVGSRQRIAQFAREHRDFNRLGPHYEQVLSRLA